MTRRIKIALMCLGLLAGCDIQAERESIRKTYVDRRIKECASLREIGCEVDQIRIRPGAFGTVVECVADCGDMR